MKGILKKFDFFPENFSLNVNGKGSKKSVIGGLMTFISIFSAFVISSILLNDFVNNRKITLISQVLYDPNMQPLKIFYSDLQFGFSLWDSLSFKVQSNPFVYTHVVQADLDMLKIISNNTPESFRVPKGVFVPCTHNNTATDFEPYIEKFGLLGLDFSQIYCIDLWKNIYNYMLSGGNLMYIYKQELIHFYFEVDSCKFDPTNCNNTSLMNEKGFQMTFLFKDNYFNVQEPKGYTTFLNTYMLPFTIGKNTDVYMSLVKNELVSDDGLFLKNEETSYFINYDNIRQYTNDKIKKFYTLNDGDNISTLNIYIETPIRYQKFIRTYSKIDSLFASINVFIALSFMLGRILTMMINLGEIDHYIMKKLYFFEEIEENYKESLRPNKVIVKKRNIKNIETPRIISTDFNLITKRNYTKSPPTENEDENDNPFNYLFKKRTLERNWSAAFLYALGLSNCIRLTNPNILYKYGKSMLTYDLNALIIIKKLLYFESVLKVLFNEDQMNLLKVIRSRYINVGIDIEETLNKLHRIDNSDFKDKNKIQEIKKSYNVCCNDKHSFSKKIVNLI